MVAKIHPTDAMSWKITNCITIATMINYQFINIETNPMCITHC